MIAAKVIGSVVSTFKHPCYNGRKILLVKAQTPQGELKGETMAAVDLVGAGIGDRVLVASEGRAAEELLHFPCRMPLRSLIVGIIDEVKEE